VTWRVSVPRATGGRCQSLPLIATDCL
jgi:hypothetical protein